MKKILNKLFLGLILLSLFAPALAQADDSAFTTGTTPTQFTGVTGTVPNPNASLSQTGDTGSGPTVSNTVAASQNSLNPSVNPAASVTSNTTVSGDIGCSLSGANGVALCISGLVEYVMVGLGAYAANITAYVFDYAVQLSLNSPAYALDFIALGWGVVRDVANMSFLFILIYIAFKIMFQAETAGTIRMLVWVVAIALLVNFSFFFTRIVIDAGNIVASQFYNTIQEPVLGQNTTSTAFASSLNNYGNAGTKDLTASIMNALNVQAMTKGSFQNWAKGQAAAGASAMYLLVTLSIIYIMTGVALYMLAGVFIFVAVKFLLRIIGLWFVIISAPLAFVAAVFRNDKNMSKWFNQWFGLLIKFSFYPAIFLFMFWIETIFLQEMAGSSLFNSVINAAQTTGSVDSLSAIALTAANVGIRLGFIIATLYVSLKVSDMVVQEGSGFAGRVRGMITGAGFGALRLDGRTLGYAAQPIRNGIQSQANAAERANVNRTLWRGINRVTGGTTLAPEVLKKQIKENPSLLTARREKREEEDRKTKEKAEAADKARKETVATTPAVAATPSAAGAIASSARATNAPGTTKSANPNQPFLTRQPTAGGSVDVSNLGRILDETRKTQTQRGQSFLTKSNEPILTPGFKAKLQGAINPSSQWGVKQPQVSTVETPRAVTPQELTAIKTAAESLQKSASDLSRAAAQKSPAAPQREPLFNPSSQWSSVHEAIDYEKMKTAMREVVRKEVRKGVASIPDNSPKGTPPAAPAAARPSPPSNNDNGELIPKAA